MKVLKTAALAMALAMPGIAMAADGPLGPTSSASFTASLSVTPNTSNYVQIIGLDNIFLQTTMMNDAPTVTGSDWFCVNKNTPGSVAITVTDQSGPFGLHDGTGHSIPASAEVTHQTGSSVGSGTGTQTFIVPSSPVGCTSSSTGLSNAHKFSIIAVPEAIGDWTGTFTVLLQPN
jgi:hypothetical protein